MKKCINCEIEKDIVEFYKNKANKDGYSGKYRLNHYKNFQPLCSYTNRNIKKGLILKYEAFI